MAPDECLHEFFGKERTGRWEPFLGTWSNVFVSFRFTDCLKYMSNVDKPEDNFIYEMKLGKSDHSALIAALPQC